MTGQQSRPNLAIGAAGDAFDGKIILDAEHAHLFGIGVSQTERNALSRRGLASLAECWPQVVAQMAVRAAIQALTEALPLYWIRRSEELEQVHTAWADDAAMACRRHAWILTTEGLPPDLVAEVDDLLAVV